MPTFRHGKSAVFKIGSSATPSVVVDISSGLTDISFPRSIETAETTAFGTSAKSYVVGLTDATISASGTFDATFDSQLAGLAGVDSVSFEYGPEGATSGRVKYSGTCVLTSYESSATIGDVVKMKADFQVTGAITRTTWA